MSSKVDSNSTYVILGASGNTGSIIADYLLWKGQKYALSGATQGDCSALCTKAPKRSPRPGAIPLRSPKLSAVPARLI